MLADAIQALESTRARMDQVYGDAAAYSASLNALSGEGSLQDLLNCAVVAEG